jgi:hypothetical protein
MGDLKVRAHARNELRVQATIHVSADSRSDASVLADSIHIDVQQSLGTISVTTRYPNQLIRESLRRDRNRDVSFSVDYDLLVPERLPLTLRNQFGDVAVTGMKGGSSIVNASGRVIAGDGEGRYDIENRFGSVEALRLSGDLTIRGANGPVTASAITGTVTISNRFGKVNAANIHGDAMIVNANGSIETTAVTGRADLRTTFGTVGLPRRGSRHRVERQRLDHRRQHQRYSDDQYHVRHRDAPQRGERRHRRQRQRADNPERRAWRRRALHQIRESRCAWRQGRLAGVGDERPGQGRRR